LSACGTWRARQRRRSYPQDSREQHIMVDGALSKARSC
jgi:hypothetical protein